MLLINPASFFEEQLGTSSRKHTERVAIEEASVEAKSLSIGVEWHPG